MGFLKKAFGLSIIYSIYRILKDDNLESKKTREILSSNFEVFKPKLRELLDDITVYMDASRGISESKNKISIEDRLHDLKIKIENINSKVVANQVANLAIDASSYIEKTKNKILANNKNENKKNDEIDTDIKDKISDA